MTFDSKLRCPDCLVILSTLNYARWTFRFRTKRRQLPSSTLPSPTATAKNRPATPPVTPILGFVMNGYFVVLCRPSQHRNQ